MKAIDIMNEIFSWAPGEYNPTCDTLKAGSPDTEVSRVAVCCFTTPQVVRDAAAWGAQLLITHEPTYYDHWDNREDTPVGNAKKQLIDQSGLTIYRYHDHPHKADTDMICAGELQALNLPGKYEKGSRFGVKLKASAPSIHMISANIETEVSPIVGTEKQSEELVHYLLEEFETDPKKIWESNIFGKSLHELVNEGLHNKLFKMPPEARGKLQETIERVINEGCSGLICIIL